MTVETILEDKNAAFDAKVAKKQLKKKKSSSPSPLRLRLPFVKTQSVSFLKRDKTPKQSRGMNNNNDNNNNNDDDDDNHNNDKPKNSRRDRRELFESSTFRRERREQLARVDSVHRRTHETRSQTQRVDSIVRRAEMMNDVVANFDNSINNNKDSPALGLREDDTSSSSLDPTSPAPARPTLESMDSVLLKTRLMDQEINQLKEEAAKAQASRRKRRTKQQQPSNKNKPMDVVVVDAAAAAAPKQTRVTTMTPRGISPTADQKTLVTLGAATAVLVVLLRCCLLPTTWTSAVTDYVWMWVRALAWGSCGGALTIIALMVAIPKAAY